MGYDMPFEEALLALKRGGKLSRRQFKDTCYIFVQYPDAHSSNTEPYLCMQKGDKRFPVDLSCESIFAEDWYVLND